MKNAKFWNNLTNTNSDAFIFNTKVFSSPCEHFLIYYECICLIFCFQSCAYLHIYYIFTYDFHLAETSLYWCYICVLHWIWFFWFRSVSLALIRVKFVILIFCFYFHSKKRMICVFVNFYTTFIWRKCLVSLLIWALKLMIPRVLSHINIKRLMRTFRAVECDD